MAKRTPEQIAERKRNNPFSGTPRHHRKKKKPVISAALIGEPISRQARIDRLPTQPKLDEKTEQPHFTINKLKDSFVTTGSEEWGSEHMKRGALPGFQNNYNRLRLDALNFHEEHVDSKNPKIHQIISNKVEKALNAHSNAIQFEKFLKFMEADLLSLLGQDLQSMNHAIEDFAAHLWNLRYLNKVSFARAINTIVIIIGIPFLGALTASNVGCQTIGEQETTTLAPTEEPIINPTSTHTVPEQAHPATVESDSADNGQDTGSDTHTTDETEAEGTRVPDRLIFTKISDSATDITLTPEVIENSIETGISNLEKFDEDTSFIIINDKTYVVTGISNGNLEIIEVDANKVVIDNSDPTNISFILSKDGVEKGRLSKNNDSDQAEYTLTLVAVLETEAPPGIRGHLALDQYENNNEYTNAINMFDITVNPIPMYINILDQNGANKKFRATLDNIYVEEINNELYINLENRIQLKYFPEVKDWAQEGPEGIWITIGAMNSQSRTSGNEMMTRGVDLSEVKGSDTTGITSLTAETLLTYLDKNANAIYHEGSRADIIAMWNIWRNAGVPVPENDSFEIYTLDNVDQINMERLKNNPFYITFLYYELGRKPTYKEVDELANAHINGEHRSVETPAGTWDIQYDIVYIFDDWPYKDQELLNANNNNQSPDLYQTPANPVSIRDGKFILTATNPDPNYLTMPTWSAVGPLNTFLLDQNFADVPLVEATNERDHFIFYRDLYTFWLQTKLDDETKVAQLTPLVMDNPPIR